MLNGRTFERAWQIGAKQRRVEPNSYDRTKAEISLKESERINSKLMLLIKAGSVVEVQQNRREEKGHGMRVMQNVTESFGEDAHHDREQA
jgi:hypothetical protein